MASSLSLPVSLQFAMGLPLIAVIPLVLAVIALHRSWISYHRKRQTREQSPSGESGRGRGRPIDFKSCLPEPPGHTLKLKREKDDEQTMKGGKIKADEVSRIPAPDYRACFPDLSFPDTTAEERAQVQADKELYHMLQNIEAFPGTLQHSGT